MISHIRLSILVRIVIVMSIRMFLVGALFLEIFSKKKLKLARLLEKKKIKLDRQGGKRTYENYFEHNCFAH